MPIRLPPTRFNDAIHVVWGMSAASSINSNGASEFVFLGDPLFPGPCDQDPSAHLRKRRRYWRGMSDPPVKRRRQLIRKRSRWSIIDSASVLTKRILQYPTERPIVLWTLPSWHEQLSLWWSLDALQRSSFDWNRCWIAEVGWHEDSSNDVYQYKSLGVYIPQAFATAFESLVPLKAGVVRSGANLWRKFAAQSPLSFDRARRNGCMAFPDLARVAERYRIYFPRSVELGQNQLRLSEFDQLLFDNLQPESWLNAVEIMFTRRELGDFFFQGGDYVSLHRLRQWSKHHPQNQAVETRPNPAGASQFTEFEYRLTPHGQRLRDEGLRSANEAPPMFVGGSELFSNDRTWVRRVRGEDWWIEEMNG